MHVIHGQQLERNRVDEDPHEWGPDGKLTTDDSTQRAVAPDCQPGQRPSEFFPSDLTIATDEHSYDSVAI
jgi:hypothetical protein